MTDKTRLIPDKACLQCKGPIPWRAGRDRRENAKFCNIDCRRAYQARFPARPRIPRAVQPCGWCGKPVEFLPSQRTARKLKGVSETVYCNRDCKGKAHSRIMLGRRPSQGIYTSPATFRWIARQSFYDQCAICGWNEAPCDVAHIVSRKAGGTDTLDNVTMLCPNHHRMFDAGLIPVEEVRAARTQVLLPQAPA